MAAQSGKSFRSYVLLWAFFSSPLLSSVALSLIAVPSILGVPPSKPSAKDSVLVIVDAQNEYDHGLLAISDVKSSRAVIGDVLGKWREGGGDVVRNLNPSPHLILLRRKKER